MNDELMIAGFSFSPGNMIEDSLSKRISRVFAQLHINYGPKPIFLAFELRPKKKRPWCFTLVRTVSCPPSGFETAPYDITVTPLSKVFSSVDLASCISEVETYVGYSSAQKPTALWPHK